MPLGIYIKRLAWSPEGATSVLERYICQSHTSVEGSMVPSIRNIYVGDGAI